MPNPIYVPQDTRYSDLQTTILQIMQMQNMRQKQQREDASLQLSTLLELGGTPAPGAVENIAKNLKIDPSILTSIMKEGKFPSAAERRTAEKVGGVKAGAQAEAEVEPITTGTEIAKRKRMMPVLKEEKQQDLDLLYEQKKKDLNLQFDQEKKISEKIKVPEFKATHDYLLQNEKDLATHKLGIDKQLDKYKRDIQTTPTPKETAEINSLNAHAQYYRDLGEYHRTVRKELASEKSVNTQYTNELKRHTEFMKENSGMFYKKGKFGKLDPVEYGIGSKEETDTKAALDAAGIKYKQAESTHWLTKNKTVFIPIAPELPKGSFAKTEGGVNIKSYSKKSVTLSSGQVVARNPDGTVTINGQEYEISEE